LINQKLSPAAWATSLVEDTLSIQGHHAVIGVSLQFTLSYVTKEMQHWPTIMIEKAWNGWRGWRNIRLEAVDAFMMFDFCYNQETNHHEDKKKTIRFWPMQMLCCVK